MIDPLRRQLLKWGASASALFALPRTFVASDALHDHRLVEVRHATYVMGQIANVTLFASSVQHGDHVTTRVFEELRRLDRLLSLYDPASDISRINRRAGERAVPVHPHTRDVIMRAVDLSRQTNGAFDITLEPLMRLWGFRGSTRTVPPSDREIHSAMMTVGVGNIVIDGPNVGLSQHSSALDLGGIAVGYALDRVAAIVRQEGIDHGLVEISGDFIAIGAPPDSTGWEIGLEDPRIAYGVLERIYVNSEALSTSGNYNNVVVYQAIRYGHLLDPDCGKPAGALLSATTSARSALEADAMSTATFVTGKELARDGGYRCWLLPA